MKRKIIATSLMALSLLSGGGIVSHAQSVGEWHLYSLFADKVDKIIDAQNKVYYMSSNRLYSYDKKYNESYTYSTDNVLNDTDVTGIYYNAEKNYVLVTYSTSNIDIINDNDGTVINLSDIYIANLTYSKTINDVAFGGGKIYVATDFGLVAYDDDSKTVSDSGLYGKSAQYVTVSGDKVLVNLAGTYYFATVGARLNTVDKLTTLRSANSSTIIAGTDNGFFEYTSGKTLRFVAVDWSTKTCTNTDYSDIKNVNSIIKNDDNTGSVVTDSKIISVDFATGAVSSDPLTIPSGIVGQTIGFNKSLSSVWSGDDSGIANYDIADGSLTTLTEKFVPEAATCAKVAFIVGSADGSCVYASNIGTSKYRASLAPDDRFTGYATQQRTDVIENGKISNAAADEASTWSTKSPAYKAQVAAGNKKMFGGCTLLAVDPNNPHRYYMPTTAEGIYVVEDNKEIFKFNYQNGNMWVRNTYSFDNADSTIDCVYFDKDGNMWVGYRTGESDAAYAWSPFIMLPKKYLEGDLSQITKEDWQLSAHLGKRRGRTGESRMVICSKSNYIFTFEDIYQDYLGVYQTNGTLDDTSDDSFFELENLKDQEGSSFAPIRWACGVEDKNGQVWFGTTSGVATIPNPALCKDASYQITRPKVPRNDGTNYADYLLDAEQVNAIAVDATNRKWIGTENSGLYYVSESGDEILANFTKENSPLPSNAVTAVYCDPNSNLVYVGTPNGLLTYRSTAVAAATDYSDVYAYPNPVRPDYTGWITITGLMENSLVKIADAAGNVVYQTRSNGGMAVWDGCNVAGERVSTGVYFVFASQNENDNASAVVTKIMVVK
jgi:hypothetical protein